MLKQAYREPLVAAEQPEVRQPALRLVEGGPSRPTTINERRMRRERRAAEGRFRAASGWRIGTW